jgi:hypothetical protein
VTERPLFIDPIVTGEGDEVDENPAPRWFLLAALVILVAAAYYLGSFLSGPRASSPHRFEHGREVSEQVRPDEPAPSASGAAPSPSPAPASASASPSATAAPAASPTG